MPRSSHVEDDLTEFINRRRKRGVCPTFSIVIATVQKNVWATTAATSASSTPATPLRDSGAGLRERVRYGDEVRRQKRQRFQWDNLTTTRQMDAEQCTSRSDGESCRLRKSVARDEQILFPLASLHLRHFSHFSFTPALALFICPTRNPRATLETPMGWVGFAATATAPAPSIQDRKAIVFRAVPKIAAPSVRFF